LVTIEFLMKVKPPYPGNVAQTNQLSSSSG